MSGWTYYFCCNLFKLNSTCDNKFSQCKILYYGKLESSKIKHLMAKSRHLRKKDLQKCMIAVHLLTSAKGVRRKYESFQWHVVSFLSNKYAWHCTIAQYCKCQQDPVWKCTFIQNRWRQEKYSWQCTALQYGRRRRINSWSCTEVQHRRHHLKFAWLGGIV